MGITVVISMIMELVIFVKMGITDVNVTSHVPNIAVLEMELHMAVYKMARETVLYVKKAIKDINVDGNVLKIVKAHVKN